MSVAWDEHSPDSAITIYAETFITRVIVPTPNVLAADVFFTNISFDKTGTSLIPSATLFLRLSPLAYRASFRKRELHSK